MPSFKLRNFFAHQQIIKWKLILFFVDFFNLGTLWDPRKSDKALPRIRLIAQTAEIPPCHCLMIWRRGDSVCEWGWRAEAKECKFDFDEILRMKTIKSLHESGSVVEAWGRRDSRMCKLPFRLSDFNWYQVEIGIWNCLRSCAEAKAQLTLCFALDPLKFSIIVSPSIRFRLSTRWYYFSIIQQLQRSWIRRNTESYTKRGSQSTKGCSANAIFRWILHEFKRVGNPVF